MDPTPSNLRRDARGGRREDQTVKETRSGGGQERKPPVSPGDAGAETRGQVLCGSQNLNMNQAPAADLVAATDRGVGMFGCRPCVYP